MLKAAIIGLGVMGKNHCRVLQQIPEVEFTSYYDIYNYESYDHLKYYSDLDLLLNENKLDFVVVALPTSLHKITTLKCLDKGIHVLVEKPGSLNSCECKKLLKHPKSDFVRIGYIERFNPVIESLKTTLLYRSVQSFDFCRVGPAPTRAISTGCRLDLAVHDIDLLLYLTKSIVLETYCFKNKIINETHTTMMLSLPNDIIASITASWMVPFKKRTISVLTETSFIQADLINKTLKEYTIKDDKCDEHSYYVDQKESLKLELQAFVDFVASNKPSNLATLSDGLKVLDTIALHQ